MIHVPHRLLLGDWHQLQMGILLPCMIDSVACKRILILELEDKFIMASRSA